jgi:hypothetical protein
MELAELPIRNKVGISEACRTIPFAEQLAAAGPLNVVETVAAFNDDKESVPCWVVGFVL